MAQHRSGCRRCRCCRSRPAFAGKSKRACADHCGSDRATRPQRGLPGMARSAHGGGELGAGAGAPGRRHQSGGAGGHAFSLADDGRIAGPRSRRRHRFAVRLRPEYDGPGNDGPDEKRGLSQSSRRPKRPRVHHRRQSVFQSSRATLVESLEILAEILHPEIFAFGHRGQGWLPFA